jgi:hypothetical protein
MAAASAAASAVGAGDDAGTVLSQSRELLATGATAAELEETDSSIRERAREHSRRPWYPMQHHLSLFLALTLTRVPRVCATCQDHQHPHWARQFITNCVARIMHVL